MSDPRWFEIEATVAEAVEHLRNAVFLYHDGGFDEPGIGGGYKSAMAFMHAMQSGHPSLEGALLRILDALGEERPTGARWHEDLIRRAASGLTGAHARPAILPLDVARDANETRSFRNKAVHGYSGFDWSSARPATEAAERLATTLTPAIAAFKQAIDPP